jgi:hypothetical protein
MASILICSHDEYKAKDHGLVVCRPRFALLETCLACRLIGETCLACRLIGETCLACRLIGETCLACRLIGETSTFK